MKIGFSFGRCIRDIVNGTVEMKDVMCVIARTRIEKREQIAPVINQYMWEALYGLDHTRCLEVAYQLWDLGRLHQPRVYGSHPTQLSDRELWMDLAPTANESSEVVQSAWRNYQMAQRLVADEIPEHRFAGSNKDDSARHPFDDNF